MSEILIKIENGNLMNKTNMTEIMNDLLRIKKDKSKGLFIQYKLS
jgi:hypothetical protein